MLGSSRQRLHHLFGAAVRPQCAGDAWSHRDKAHKGCVWCKSFHGEVTARAANVDCAPTRWP